MTKLHHLDTAIQRIIAQHNIDNVSIDGVKKDYSYFSTTPELDEQLILNLIYRNMSQDIIRRNGSKRVIYYNANPEGNFYEHPKPESLRAFLKQTLSQTFLVKHLNPRQMNNLVKCLKPRTIQKDTVLITEDGIGTEMYVIESGTFEITLNGEIIEKRMSGIVGEMALLHNIRRTATVRSLEDSKVWYINLEEYIAIYDTDNLNQLKTFSACVAENAKFEDKRNVRKTGKPMYLKKGEELDNNYYYVVVFQGGKILDGNNVLELSLKDVVDSGVVVEDFEAFRVEKKQCLSKKLDKQSD